MAKILVCDDAVFMRMTIREALEHAGHTIAGEAEDADQAVTMYREKKPDLVTMDLLMKTPGTDAIKRIMALDSKAKVVVVSVLNEQEAEVVEAVRAGAQGIVTKPIKREVLIQEIERVLKG